MTMTIKCLKPMTRGDLIRAACERCNDGEDALAVAVLYGQHWAIDRIRGDSQGLKLFTVRLGAALALVDHAYSVERLMAACISSVYSYWMCMDAKALREWTNA